MTNEEILNEINNLQAKMREYRKTVLGYSDKELVDSDKSGQTPYRRKSSVIKALVEHGQFEVDGVLTTLERLQASGVKPDEMVRINRRVYMNGQLLNASGTAWEEYGIRVLEGPTVSDGLSKPVVIIDDGFNLEAEENYQKILEKP